MLKIQISVCRCLINEALLCYIRLYCSKSLTHFVVSQEGDTKVEYRAWNPFRSKLAAAILGGVDQIHIKPGAKVMYLGAASGTTVSHVSDIVGPVRIFHLFYFGNKCRRYIC